MKIQKKKNVFSRGGGSGVGSGGGDQGRCERRSEVFVNIKKKKKKKIFFFFFFFFGGGGGGRVRGVGLGGVRVDVNRENSK